jgi:hypothetical protein
VTEPVERVTRRTLFKRGGTVALGSAVIWAAPSIRSAALDPSTAGTPPPTPPVLPHSQTRTDPGAVGATDESSGQLPFTGIDPKPLLIAGGTALAAGSALMAVAQDPDPSRGES